MNETLVFKVGGNSYQIKFPNVGQYYAIQAMKQTLSLGYYNSLSQSQLVSAVNALDMIDVESTLSVLCPEMLKDFKCEKFKELGIKDYLEIKEAYRIQFMPWWMEIEKLFEVKNE